MPDPNDRRVEPIRIDDKGNIVLPDMADLFRRDVSPESREQEMRRRLVSAREQLEQNNAGSSPTTGDPPTDYQHAPGAEPPQAFYGRIDIPMELYPRFKTFLDTPEGRRVSVALRVVQLGLGGGDPLRVAAEKVLTDFLTSQ